MNQPLHVKIGKLGEALSAAHLERHGHTIIDRNYWQKCGEIDIISRLGNSVHFIEIKTVSYETRDALERSRTSVTWQPEENVHAAKQKRLARAIETWLHEKSYQGDWQVDIVIVKLVPREKLAVIDIMADEALGVQ